MPRCSAGSTTWPSPSARERWERLRARLAEAGIAVHEVGGTSLYFSGPDGERIELIADPLGEMYGSAEFLSGVKRHDALAWVLDGPVDGALCDSLFRRLVRLFALVVRRCWRTSSLMV